MKYSLLIMLLPAFLHADPDKELSLSEQKDQMIYHIINPNTEKFKKAFNIFNGKKNDEKKEPENLLSTLFEKYQQLENFTDNLNIVQLLSSKKEEPELTKDEILKQVKEKVQAKKFKFLNEQDEWKSQIFGKLWTGLSYLGAAFGLWTLGYLCYKGCIEEVEYTPTEQFIYNCLGMHPIIVPLTSNPKTSYTLLGLCAASSYYGVKEIYAGIFFKAHTQQNLESAQEIEKLIKKEQEKKEN